MTGQEKTNLYQLILFACFGLFFAIASLILGS